MAGTSGQLPPDSQGPLDVEVGNFPDDSEWKVLYDAGNGNKPFLRRYDTDPATGVVTTVDTELDGTTPYVPTGPEDTCCPDTDSELVTLVDSNGDEFLRLIQYGPDGTVTSVTDTTLDGSTPFVPVGPNSVAPGGPFEVTGIGGGDVIVGDGGGSITVDDGGLSLTVDGTVDIGNLPDDSEVEILADSGAGDRIFLRRYVTDDAGVVTIVDTDLDGTTAYAVTAEANVTPPPVDVTLADDTEGFILCDDGIEFIRRFIYNPDGSIDSTVDTDLAGGAYVVSGTVGLCPDGGVRIDTEVVCFDSGPSPLFRRVTYNATDGSIISISYFDSAGSPAVPTGTPVNCGEGPASVVTVIGPVGPGACADAVRVTQCEPVGIDDTTPINVNIAASDCEGDCEYLILTDTGVDTDFLRQICTDCAGAETVTDTELDGVTPFVVSAESNVKIVLRGALRDTEILVLCDTGNANKQFVMRYTFNNNGTVRSTTELEFDGTAYAGFVGPAAACETVIDDSTPIDVAITGQPISVDDNGGSLTVDDGGGSLTVDGTVDIGNHRDDVEILCLCDDNTDPPTPFLRRYEYLEDGSLDATADTGLDGSTPYVVAGNVVKCPSGLDFDDDNDVEEEVLCDVQGDGSIVEFLRRYLWANDGSLVGAVDRELDGTTVYTVTGTVRDCAVAAVESQDCQSGFGGNPVLTALNSSGDTHTTDADARRITINYQANSASGANRPTISVNGGAATILGKNGDQSQIIFGTLDTCASLGYTLTIEVNQNNQDIDVIEEF